MKLFVEIKVRAFTNIMMFTAIAHLSGMNTIMTVVITAEVSISFKFEVYLFPNLKPISHAMELKINNKSNILATEVCKLRNCTSNILKLPKYII
jgi:hypothetical protein